MSKFEEIEPTDLLMQIRNGEDGLLQNRAKNFGFFLQRHIDGLAEQHIIIGRDSAGTELQVEIIMTGLQLAIEEQRDKLQLLLDTSKSVTE